tara:strand:+ start:209 stop:1198 length:990 start_codon:yes stop_codon:yes gene_type:complete
MANVSSIPTLMETIDSFSMTFLDKPEIKGLFIGLLILTATISLLSRIFTSFKDKKEIDWVGWILDITGVVCASLLVTVFFKGMVFLMSYIANVIYPFDLWDQFLMEQLDTDIGKNLESLSESEEGSINSSLLGFVTTKLSFLDITFQKISTILFNVCFYVLSLGARMCFWLLLLWRSLYLLVLLSLSYVHIAKSLLPSYGIQSLFGYIQEIIQVSSWSIYFSAGLFVMREMEMVIQKVYISDNLMTLFTIPMGIVVDGMLHLIFIIYVLSIPKFASKHFGGIDTSSIMYGATALPVAMASMGANAVGIVKNVKELMFPKSNLGGSNETA